MAPGVCHAAQAAGASGKSGGEKVPEHRVVWGEKHRFPYRLLIVAAGTCPAERVERRCPHRSCSPQAPCLLKTKKLLDLSAAGGAEEPGRDQAFGWWEFLSAH